ncbi:hypothetical protein LZ31DRAFT_223590 [Colletotrichum somersetense]|nr:hypothetical protein LZ31DRAFT_223590 [Colletotrichum somersetense]
MASVVSLAQTGGDQKFRALDYGKVYLQSSLLEYCGSGRSCEMKKNVYRVYRFPTWAVSREQPRTVFRRNTSGDGLPGNNTSSSPASRRRSPQSQGSKKSYGSPSCQSRFESDRLVMWDRQPSRLLLLPPTLSPAMPLFRTYFERLEWRVPVRPIQSQLQLTPSDASCGLEWASEVHRLVCRSAEWPDGATSTALLRLVGDPARYLTIAREDEKL